MAVNFPSIDPAQLHPVAGVTLGWAEANIRKPNRKDVLVISVEEGATVAGVFTENRFCAAPVIVCREHLAAVRAGGPAIRALVVNTGNANAVTGELGLAATRATCDELARLAGLQPSQVLPFSTGVILEPLPVDRLKAGLPAALANRAARQLVQRRAGDHDHRYAAQGRLAPGHDRRSHGHTDRYQQGCRHDQAEHGHHARLPGPSTPASRSPCSTSW